VEDLVTPQFWQDRRVFITGHTGFKGGWLAIWLHRLGARLHGYSLAPPTFPSLFQTARIDTLFEVSTTADIRDAETLATAFAASEASVVFHLAAQALVRDSYATPVETFATNVMGTVHLLDAARRAGRECTVVVVTTDKCYENHRWVWPYRESDPLGGDDPYSASKACAEIVTAAYRRSFLSKARVNVATARAGNVIGGGDWASERLMPDFFRALDADKDLVIRSPNATRPWQHVLEPVAGYVVLAEKLTAGGAEYAEAWNFGPAQRDAQTVGQIVEQLCAAQPGARWRIDSTPMLHEAAMLTLDSSKAAAALPWHPRWRLMTALHKCLDWHRHWRAGDDMLAISREQVAAYAAVSPLA
jgi:CDP-glucose 4,6-dehydratase